jgi:hypothetical protein
MKKLKKLHKKLTGHSTSSSPSCARNTPDLSTAESTSARLENPTPTKSALLGLRSTDLQHKNRTQELVEAANVGVGDPTISGNTLTPSTANVGSVPVPEISGLSSSSATPTSDNAAKVHMPTGKQHDQSPLSSSKLWERALEKVKTDNGWNKYAKIVDANAILHNSNVDRPEGIVAVAQTISNSLEASKVVLRLAGRAIVIRDTVDKAVGVLAVLKDVGASATAVNPCAAVTWGGFQFFVQAAITHQEVGALCWDELPQMVLLISEYQTFELLYDTSQLKDTRSKLEDTLVDLFGSILRYQIVIVTYASSLT